MTVSPEVDAGASKDAAFVFVKPHAVNDKVKELVTQKLKSSGITVVSEGSIAAEKIDKDQLIDTHYGAIAAKAVKLKPEALVVQPKAKEDFEKKFGSSWEDALKSGQVYNAMDAVAKLGITTDELNDRWDGSEKLKFGGGFYCGKIGDIFVINAFYMSMRGKFTSPGASIYYYEVEWNPKDLSWADFRQKVLGGTDPKTAQPDSARNQIYSNWEGLGLKSCPNTGDNGVHASASPFEALAERCNWLGASFKEDFYGKALLASGVSEDMLTAWFDDPPVNFEGKDQSLFDLLEDLDARECLEKSASIAGTN
jgi:nucleoside diphosphate kinase